MDKERSRDLMTRGRSSARRFSPARRHPMRSSSIVINDNNRSDGGDGERYRSVSRSLKKGKARVSRWRSSNNGAEGMVSGTGSEGDPPLTTTNNNNDVSARRRVRLREKVSEDGDAMDPASVPRRLRSAHADTVNYFVAHADTVHLKSAIGAINKRSNQSASPPLADTRKKCRHTSNESQLPYVIDENKSEQNALTNSMTKEDEDVARILYALANMIPICQLIKDEEDRKTSEDMPNINANNASHSEGPVLADSKEEDANNSQACIANEVTNLSTGLEEPISETAKTEPSLEQPVIILESSTVEPEPNKAAKSDVPTTILLSKIDHAESTSSMNAANSLRSSGASSQYYSGNGSLPPTKRDALPAPLMQKPVIAPWPFGSTRSATVKHEGQPDKQRTDTGANVAHREGTDPLVPSGLPTSTQAPSTMLSTGKTAVWPAGSAASTTGLNSTGNGPRTQKSPAMPLNVLCSRKRCATHVYLSNLTRHHQNMERKSSLSVPPNQSKSKDGSNLGVPAANETARLRNGLSCMASAGTNGSLMERNAQEARLQMSNAGRLLRAQQASTLSETYAPQKQNCNFLSLSAAGGETSYSGNGVKLSGQTHLSLVPQRAAHHSVMPFGYSHVPQLTPCTEKLPSVAAQQLQQLPQYMGNPFYGPQMGHAGCLRPQPQPQPQPQQQPMWPNHLAHYKPAVGFPMWQNGRLQDLSRQLQLRAQASPAISPSPAIEAHPGAYHPLHPQHHQLQLQVNPSLSSSSSTKHHLSGLFNNGGYRPQVSSQLQVLCNAQRS